MAQARIGIQVPINFLHPGKQPFFFAKDRIEAFPKVRTHEMIWYRSKPGELRYGARRRMKDEVKRRRPEPGDRSEIHTHTWPSKRSELRGLSISSMDDFAAWMQAVRESNLRFFHMDTIGPRGKDRGRVTYMATQKFVALAANEPNYIKLLYDDMGEPSKAQFERRLLENGMLRRRALPMPGHYFNEKLGRFVRKKI